MNAPTRTLSIDRRLLRVSSAHLIVDSYTNVYAPLLPLLIPKLHLTLGAVGALAMIFQMAASVSQLAFGRLADRWHPHRLLVGGPIVTVVVLSLIGLAPSVFWLSVILIVGGLGAAAFHPPGAMAAHRFGQPRPGFAMSLFVGSGATGFALSPLLFSSVTGAYGLEATWWLMFPGLLALAWILRDMPAVPASAHPGGQGLRALKPYARPLGLLYAIVVLRTVAGLSFVTFVPILLTHRGLSVRDAGTVVAIYLLAASAGGFAGGPLADRFGPRRVIAASLVLAVPFLAAGSPARRLIFYVRARPGRVFPAVHAARQRRVRADAGAGQRRHRVVADDGGGLGHGRPADPVHRPARRSYRRRAGTHRHGARADCRCALCAAPARPRARPQRPGGNRALTRLSYFVLRPSYFECFWYDAVVPRSPYSVSYSIGPGPLTRGVKWLLIANVAAFVITAIVGRELEYQLVQTFGLTPALVFERLQVWQLATYMFLHADLMHLLFNMLVLWMFGVPLERRWGYAGFMRFYFVCGIGAALTSLVAAWLPFEWADTLYRVPTIGASGAIYGLLVAFGMLFPDQVILLFIFPVPARVYVFIAAALVLWSSISNPAGGTAHMAHLGGMLVGYLYLTRGRGGPWAEIRYRMLKWKMNRARKKFDVHPGGRGGWGRQGSLILDLQVQKYKVRGTKCFVNRSSSYIVPRTSDFNYGHALQSASLGRD